MRKVDNPFFVSHNDVYKKTYMKNDFRKYAVQHLGMNGLVLDDVMKAQAQYLNPYILEETDDGSYHLSGYTD